MRRLAILMATLLFFGVGLMSSPGLSRNQQQKDVKPLDARINACWQKAMTQRAMDECAGLERRTAEEEMDDTLRQVLGKFSNDAVKTKAIKAAQAAWVAYRYAELNALYPPSEEEEMGSVHVMCQQQDSAELTRERTKELRKMLRYREGDACSQ
jgi:uncharacterized protein YecT (DUF1311 family)